MERIKQKKNHYLSTQKAGKLTVPSHSCIILTLLPIPLKLEVDTYHMSFREQDQVEKPGELTIINSKQLP